MRNHPHRERGAQVVSTSAHLVDELGFIFHETQQRRYRSFATRRARIAGNLGQVVGDAFDYPDAFNPGERPDLGKDLVDRLGGHNASS
jgi:hypothetical protein